MDARIHRALADIPARAWDALHDGRNPFVAHAFLDGMEREGVIDPRLGWTPWHLGVWDGDTLVAAAPVGEPVELGKLNGRRRPLVLEMEEQQRRQRGLSPGRPRVDSRRRG